MQLILLWLFKSDWPELMQTFIFLPFNENQILLNYFFYHLKSVFRKNSFVCKLFKCPILSIYKPHLSKSV